MGTQRIRKIKAVRKNPDPDLKLLSFSENVVNKCTGNANFMNAGAVFTNLAAANANFATTIQNMKTQKDAGPAKEAARAVVIQNLDHGLDYVNGQASQASPAQAAAIIASSGYSLRQVPVHTKSALEAKYANVSGAVLLMALAAGRGAVYVFEYSTDMKTWTTMPQVFKCKTIISGLTVGTTYYFRFQAQTSKGLQGWSDAVSFFVR
jgi:hypothetical protein